MVVHVGTDGEGIEQQQAEERRAEHGEEAHLVVAAGGARREAREEGNVTVELQVVDAVAKGHGACDDAQQVEQQRACAQHLAYHQHGGSVAGRAGHEQHETRAGGEALEHECHGDGYGTRGAEVHGHGDDEYQQERGQGVAAEKGEGALGHEHRDEARHDDANGQPFANVLHHLHKGVVQGFEAFRPKTLRQGGRRLCGGRGRGGVGFVPVGHVDQRAAPQGCDERGDGTDEGEGPAHQAVSGYDGVDARLRRGNEKRGNGAARGPLATQRHGGGYDAARA